MNRRKADRIIDDAHNCIACAEMGLLHYVPGSGDELVRAQRYLARAIATRDAWDATDHDDYEEYPDVPRDEQTALAL